MTTRARLRGVCGAGPVKDASADNPVMVTVRRGDVADVMRVVTAAENLETRRRTLENLRCQPTPPHELAAARRNYRTAWDVLRACLQTLTTDPEARDG
jgi:hypothetical protein